jgi:hypothetical protein
LLLLLFAETVLGQVQGTVVDKATGKLVAYANIWVENENLGVTASETGAFSFGNASVVGKMLVVSCLGYERGRFAITSENVEVRLQPAAVELQEITVRPTAPRQKLVVGKLVRKSPAHWYANGGVPWIVASFMPFSPNYEATPFLDQVSFVLWSRVANAKFQIRLLEVGENGQPGKDLLPKPLIGTSPKGVNVEQTLDLSQYNLKIPKEGLFIAFEWFIIPENAIESSSKKKGSKEKIIRISYGLSILTQNEPADGQIGWIYTQGAWRNSDFKTKDGKIIPTRAPQFQLTLSD